MDVYQCVILLLAIFAVHFCKLSQSFTSLTVKPFAKIKLFYDDISCGFRIGGQISQELKTKSKFDAEGRFSIDSTPDILSHELLSIGVNVPTVVRKFWTDHFLYLLSIKELHFSPTAILTLLPQMLSEIL